MNVRRFLTLIASAVLVLRSLLTVRAGETADEGLRQMKRLVRARFPEVRQLSAAELLPTLPPERPVVLYCAVGYRSSEVATRLLRAGRTNVANLEGSIFEWANEGRPLERDGQPAATVHPYNGTFGRLLKPGLRAASPEAPK